MTDRVIATVCSRDGYAGLMAALLARMLELDTTCESVDEVAGLPDRYVSKLFAPVPIKGIGRKSLGPLLRALGIKLILVEDSGIMGRVREELSRRETVNRNYYAGRKVQATRPRKRNTFPSGPDFARVMRARQLLTQTPKQRSAIARKAAKARWRKKR